MSYEKYDKLEDYSFRLTPMDVNSVRNDVMRLMTYDEEPIMAFRTVRDQVIFTNKRIISIDVTGITGKSRIFRIMPYSKIQFFSIETPGFAELFPRSRMYVQFNGGYKAKFDFSGNVDIGGLARMISEYVL